jgi:hypothetical protein
MGCRSWRGNFRDDLTHDRVANELRFGQITGIFGRASAETNEFADCRERAA